MFHRDPATRPVRTPAQAEGWRCLQAARAAEVAGELEASRALYMEAFHHDRDLELVA